MQIGVADRSLQPNASVPAIREMAKQMTITRTRSTQPKNLADTKQLSLSDYEMVTRQRPLSSTVVGSVRYQPNAPIKTSLVTPALLSDRKNKIAFNLPGDHYENMGKAVSALGSTRSLNRQPNSAIWLSKPNRVSSAFINSIVVPKKPSTGK